MQATSPNPASHDYLLGFDPGKDKCGLAVVDYQGIPQQRQVIPSSQALERVKRLYDQQVINRVILGNQTTSRQWQQQLQQTLPDCPIELVDERHSSLEAQQRYWDYYPARGWNRFLPKGLRVPPDPYDDIVALILVERYLRAHA
ncbi:MAG: Holliday junction resolvase RuvX [Cyanobacteriota bacterium]|nr:Holliday junction resolvase RuvX [Cyanobacteriota bacterium]